MQEVSIFAFFYFLYLGLFPCIGFKHDPFYSAIVDLLNVFEVFLPQLLLYPNPSDPLNGDAASLMMKDKKQYDQKVKGDFRLPFLLLRH